MRYIYIYSIEFGMLEVRENEIALRKLSGGTAQLRTLEGRLGSCPLSYAYDSEYVLCPVTYLRIGKIGHGLRPRTTPSYDDSLFT